MRIGRKYEWDCLEGIIVDAMMWGRFSGSSLYTRISMILHSGQVHFYTRIEPPVQLTMMGGTSRQKYWLLAAAMCFCCG